jgi:RIO kinase 1
MRIPDTLTALVDQGVIEEVLRPLMSGKEAQIYLVVSGGRECVAKIYKEAQNRTFKHRADYTEGRKVRNTRDQRAINKRSQHGRDQDEAAWRSTEVDMIYRLRNAGVRVPEPYNYIDGVLVMELVTDGNGQPAARLGELDFTPDEATAVYQGLIRDVVRMLCAGVVHGDLSDFNVLLGADGPVIIDFPQSVDPSKNQNARKLLLRDVDNLHRFYTRFVPTARRMPYAEEMWALYESNQLTAETVLKGQYRGSQKKANTDALLEFLGEVNEDERRRRSALGQNADAVPPKPRRVEVIVNKTDARGPRAPFAKGPRGTPPPGNARGPRPMTQPHPGAPPALNGGAPTRSIPAFSAPGGRGPEHRGPEHRGPDRSARDRGAPERGAFDRAAASPSGATSYQPSNPADPTLAQAPARRRRRRKPNANGGGMPPRSNLQQPAPEPQGRPAPERSYSGAPERQRQPAPERPYSAAPERQRPAPERPYSAAPERQRQRQLAPERPDPAARGPEQPQRGADRPERSAPARFQPATSALDASVQRSEQPRRSAPEQSQPRASDRQRQPAPERPHSTQRGAELPQRPFDRMDRSAPARLQPATSAREASVQPAERPARAPFKAPQQPPKSSS